MKNKAAYLSFCILLLSYTAWCQTQKRSDSGKASTTSSDTRVNLQRIIDLENDSKSKTVLIDIEDDVEMFELMIKSSVVSGKLTIEVSDPKGHRQETFSVGTQLNLEKSERVNGNINKTLNDPQPGNWEVSIIPTNATGYITIQTSLKKQF